MAVFILLLMLAFAFVPASNHVCVKGAQTKALAQAKQVGLALKIFAADHDGNYPRVGVPKEMISEPNDANGAFACLFPTYTQSERIFGNRVSAYQARQPDDIIDASYTGKPQKTLESGENVYGYMLGLTDKSGPDSPLVADGTDGSGHYNTVPSVRGGTWGPSKRAVLIHLDNSGSVQPLRGPDNSLYIPRPSDPGRNALDAAYLGQGTRFLDPAIAGP